LPLDRAFEDTLQDHQHVQVQVASIICRSPWYIAITIPWNPQALATSLASASAVGSKRPVVRNQPDDGRHGRIPATSRHVV
jgi:hypothetical protein